MLWKKLTSSLFLLLTGCGAQSKFDWDASESAPQNYPMQVIDGRFFITIAKAPYISLIKLPLARAGDDLFLPMQ
ncbi:hypothetical protein [Agarilytica rhodophyticola]|uniref:hypothetical protein n=1 Tax=Agarilytica rhodophyticola TaxID=1737490 RepID=UPI000B345C7D|nr:hypothetical protein [Agarilytica rhodophyticola]